MDTPKQQDCFRISEYLIITLEDLLMKSYDQINLSSLERLRTRKNIN